ncbi:AAA family ATPase, partial [Stenotrophomonas maltophilia]|uniref:AAA family ATPase n=3 Tax=Stenotrophomonas maltophilia TaxID=40324 RepID=UPI001C6096F9
PPPPPPPPPVVKISRVHIENFRSIETCDVSFSDFNIIVGQNNTGKTNFFEAISWFYSGSTAADSMKYRKDSTLEVVVTIHFTGAQQGANNMLNEGNKAKILSVLGDSDVISVTRRSSDARKRTVQVDGADRKNPTGFDTALNDFLPKFEYIHTRQFYEEFAKYNQKSAVGVMLSSVIEAILMDDPTYRSFMQNFEALFNAEDSAVGNHFKAIGQSVRKHLEKQFSECSMVQFEVLSPEFSDLLKKFETVVDDGIETYASEKGDGMQRALMLAIIQAYADYRRARDDQGKSFLFFIDEAELHLHPTAQRRLKQVLLELSSTLDQVVISTHSSVFLADSEPSESILKCEKTEGRTELSATHLLDRPYIIYDLLGGSPADLLLPRSFLIVEGPSEVDLLTRVIKRFYSNQPTIQIIAANGDVSQSKRTIDAVAKAYSVMSESLYRDRSVVLCDSPSEEKRRGFDNFLQAHAHLQNLGHIMVLPTGSLEESYPDQMGWKRTSEEVAGMKGSEKRSLAKEVGDRVSKEAFEAMPKLHEALLKAWSAAR